MTKALKKIKSPLWFWILFGAIIVLAISSHFYGLSWRPSHHDEGMLSYFSWKLATEGSYIYTPLIHGPILFYVQAAFFKFLGASQETFRIGPALFGSVLVIIPLLFRKLLKTPTAIFLSILLLVSPMMLYSTRFLVHTAFVIVFWLLVVLYLKQFFSKPGMLSLHLSALFLALAFGTSETTYILFAILIGFIIVLPIFSMTRFKAAWKKVYGYFREDPYQLLSAFLLFVAVWVLVYSVGATNYQSLAISYPNPFSATTGLGLMLANNKQHLGSQPWFYYIMLVAVYEPAILVADIMAIVALRRNKGSFYFFAVWWAITTVAVFSYTGEKFPWLALCPLLTMIFLAAVYLGGSFNKFKLWSKIVFLILFAFSVYNSVRVNFTNIADTRELLTYVQTPKIFQSKINQINSICGKTSGCVAIDQDISWPMSWSFKENGFLFYANSADSYKNAKFIILNPSDQAQFVEPAGYQKETIQLRDWWVPEKCHKLSCATKLTRYFLFREIYGLKGGFDVFLYSKMD
jgi:uncharacterized protein (TIGR03663 family)